MSRHFYHNSFPVSCWVSHFGVRVFFGILVPVTLSITVFSSTDIRWSCGTCFDLAIAFFVPFFRLSLILLCHFRYSFWNRCGGFWVSRLHSVDLRMYSCDVRNINVVGSVDFHLFIALLDINYSGAWYILFKVNTWHIVRYGWVWDVFKKKHHWRHQLPHCPSRIYIYLC